MLHFPALDPSSSSFPSFLYCNILNLLCEPKVDYKMLYSLTGSSTAKNLMGFEKKDSTPWHMKDSNNDSFQVTDFKAKMSRDMEVS